MSFIDQIIEFAKVTTSEVRGANAAVLFDLVGMGGFSADGSGNLTAADLSDDAAEQSPQQPNYQALGVIARPLPPDDVGFLEAIAARTSDGLEPFAYRDLRLNRAINPTGEGNAPAAGQTMFAGYGGGFLSHQMTVANVGSQKGSITTIYVPYAFDGDGVPTKAHAIIVDPTSGNSSIQLIHGDGVFFQLTEETGAGPGIIAAINGSTFLRMADGEVTLQAEKILLKGNVYLGREAELGVPIALGTLSPAGSTFASVL